MRLKKVHLIDSDGFYKEDEIIEIPDTLEEAKLLKYPIVKRLEPNPSPQLEEPESLKGLRSQLSQLKSLPQSEIIESAIASTQLELDLAIAQFEKVKTDNQFVEVEEFQIPPLASNQIETELTGSFYRAKWDGFKWSESMTAEEIEAKYPRLPDWSGFVQGWIASDLDDLLMTTAKPAWLTRFLLAIDKAPNVDIDTFATAFNHCVSGLTEAPTAEQKTELRSLFEKNLIPLKVKADGTIASKS